MYAISTLPPARHFGRGSLGAEFQPVLAPQSHEHVVEKNVPCAFTHSGLERWLHLRGVKRLVIVGVRTSSSVEATARNVGKSWF